MFQRTFQPSPTGDVKMAQESWWWGSHPFNACICSYTMLYIFDIYIYTLYITFVEYCIWYILPADDLRIKEHTTNIPQAHVIWLQGQSYLNFFRVMSCAENSKALKAIFFLLPAAPATADQECSWHGSSRVSEDMSSCLHICFVATGVWHNHADIYIYIYIACPKIFHWFHWADKACQNAPWLMTRDSESYRGKQPKSKFWVLSCKGFSGFFFGECTGFCCTRRRWG